MHQTRIHELTTFYSHTLPPKAFPHAAHLPRKALVVLALVESVGEPESKPIWTIDLIGDMETYFTVYWDILCAVLNNGLSHPVARNQNDLHKHLRVSFKRHRELTFMELQARGITTCYWPADAVAAQGVQIPEIIQPAKHKKGDTSDARLELTLDSNAAAQAMTTLTLMLQDAHQHRHPNQRIGSGLIGLPYTQAHPVTQAMPGPTPRTITAIPVASPRGHTPAPHFQASQVCGQTK